ncbi:MAG: hypothetical protein U9P14_10275, partial [Gemmatimonadota bacterium]|nr:hypothetical protein [Gemmatimonadota bacterium]
AGSSHDVIGRYQLFHGSYDHYNLDENEGFERQSIMKIDTVSGQVWELQSFNQDGELITDWKELGKA